MPATRTTAVAARTKKGTEYLTIIEIDSDKLVIKPTKLGKQQLNGFWPEWLRHELLSRWTGNKISVELYGKQVVVRFDARHHGELASSVPVIAQIIRPLTSPLEKRKKYHDGSTRCMVWDWEGDHELAETILSRIRLPRGARLCTNNGFWFSLNRRQDCPLKIGELARMVEYQVALICLEH